MPEFTVRAMAHVQNSRLTLEDDHWGGLVSEIVLEPELPDESLDGIEAFSHAEVVFTFHRAGDEKTVSGARHPRGNPDYPAVGIFAQRNKDRPNHLGLSIARILRRERRSLFVEGLDAVDGTPVLDIKPVMVEYLPRGEIRQPDWTGRMLKDYWKDPNEEK
jgi:tRNA (adenine37-N6)-methyltransferase